MPDTSSQSSSSIWQIATVIAAWFGSLLGVVNFLYNRSKDKPKIIVRPKTQGVKITKLSAGWVVDAWKGTGVYLDIVNKRSFLVEIREAGLTLDKGSPKRFRANRPMEFNGKWLAIPDWPCPIEGNMHCRAEIDPHLHLDEDFKNIKFAYVELVTGEVFYGKMDELKKFLDEIAGGNIPLRGNSYEWDNS
jgi:hypothetical protein